MKPKNTDAPGATAGAGNNVIPVIPTYSNRKRVAYKFLNEIAAAHPEFVSSLKVMVCYPLIKWAMRCRAQAEGPMFTAQAIPAAAAVWEEVARKKRSMTADRYLVFGVYPRIAETVEEAFESLKVIPGTGDKMFRTVSDIHGGEPHDGHVSIYYINTHYRNAVINVCSKYRGEFDALYEEVNSLVAEDYFERAVNPAMETAAMLADNYPALQFRETFSEACLRMREAVDACYGFMSCFPRDAELTRRVMQLKMQGANRADDLKAGMDLAWNTVVRYRTQVSAAIAGLLFGLTVDEMIFWLWQVQAEA